MRDRGCVRGSVPVLREEKIRKNEGCRRQTRPFLRIHQDDVDIEERGLCVWVPDVWPCHHRRRSGFRMLRVAQSCKLADATKHINTDRTLARLLSCSLQARVFLFSSSFSSSSPCLPQPSGRPRTLLTTRSTRRQLSFLLLDTGFPPPKVPTIASRQPAAQQGEEKKTRPRRR